MNNEEQLNKLKQDLEKYKNLKYKAEARLEQLNVQRDNIIEEIKAEGINPENLEDEILKLEEEISSLFKRAEELLPRE